MENRKSGPGTKPPEARIRARNEAKILKAAVNLFATKGFDGTHIKEIALLSGLPKTNVYYYFPSKEKIYITLIERLIDRWDQAFEHIVVEREPREAIAAYVRAKIDYSRQNSVESRFFASEVLRGGNFLTKRHRSHMREVTENRAHVVEEWIRQKKIAPINVRHFFILLWSSTEFYADFEFIAADALQKKSLLKADYNDAAETIIQIVLNGIIR